MSGPSGANSSGRTIKRLIKEKGGIQLDIGCGHNKQGPEWVGMDVQELQGVDIVHDFNLHPWPPATIPVR